MGSTHKLFRKGNILPVILPLAGLALALLLLSIPAPAGAVGVTHNVYGKLLNADGSAPRDGDVQFTAYISSRPGEKINNPGAAGSGYKEGWWVVNVGNFPSAWKVGDVLVVEFNNVSNGQRAVLKQTLEASQPQETVVRLQVAR